MQSHIFLTSPLVTGEWSASCLEKRAPFHPQILMGQENEWGPWVASVVDKFCLYLQHFLGALIFYVSYYNHCEWMLFILCTNNKSRQQSELCSAGLLQTSIVNALQIFFYLFLYFLFTVIHKFSQVTFFFWFYYITKMCYYIL